mgnify:FL=1
MQDITAPYEYVVAEKKTPKLRARRAGLIALYILFPIVALVITAMSKVGPLLAAMCTFLAIATWMLVFFTWRYVSVEYEYTVVSGRVTFCKIYGGRSRKKLLEFMIKDAELIAPTDDVNIGKVKYFEPEKTYSALSAEGAEDGYFMLFRNAEKEKCVFYFEATAQMLKICRFYNPGATVMSKVRY